MNQVNKYQKQYWNELVQLKAHIFYLDEYLTGTVRIDRWVNTFLAIASSTSIATWAVWQKYQLFWAALIGLSQVITAVKPWLPYENRRQAISGLISALNDVWLLAARSWYDVANGKLNQQAIYGLVSDIREKKEAVTQKHLSSRSLPDKQQFLETARFKTATFFRDIF